MNSTLCKILTRHNLIMKKLPWQVVPYVNMKYTVQLIPNFILQYKTKKFKTGYTDFEKLYKTSMCYTKTIHQAELEKLYLTCPICFALQVLTAEKKQSQTKPSI